MAEVDRIRERADFLAELRAKIATERAHLEDGGIDARRAQFMAEVACGLPGDVMETNERGFIVGLPANFPPLRPKDIWPTGR